MEDKGKKKLQDLPEEPQELTREEAGQIVGGIGTVIPSMYHKHHPAPTPPPADTGAATGTAATGTTNASSGSGSSAPTPPTPPQTPSTPSDASQAPQVHSTIMCPDW